jgi:aminoglycoside phosphotransferase (APT) family kinase protein
VCRFGPRSVVKFTAVTRAAEAVNIEYIAQNTTIPVPRIQDVFMIGNRTYIVMDYINGSEMTYVSDTLSPEQNQAIRLQMKGYMSQMRALKPPNPGRVEAADGSGLFDIRLTSSPFDPFPSVKEFHARLGHEFVLRSQDHRHMWSQFAAVAQRRYRTTFSHGDLAPRNIIIKDGRIAAIVDWESAGWYPEYWEYARWADSNFRSTQMWHGLRDEILDPYPDELRVDEYLGGVFTRL